MSGEAHRLRMARYRAKTRGSRCGRCSRPLDSKDFRLRCPICLAEDAEKKHPEKEHDTELHAEYLVRARASRARCEATDLSLDDLVRAGMSLQVDRIDPARGYVDGNMQIVASYLNALKGRERSWPWWAIDEVRSRVECAKVDASEARFYMPEWGY